MSTLTVPETHALSRTVSLTSSIASRETTNSFLPVIKQEDLFSASFVLSAVSDANDGPRAPYLRPVSTFATPHLSPSGMKSSDTLVSTATAPPLPPTRPLVISHHKRSLRSRLSLSRAPPTSPTSEVGELRSKRAFSLPFNLPSHSSVSLALSSNASVDLPNLLLDIGHVGTDSASVNGALEDASWVPPPPPVAKGLSEAPVKGKGGPGWYGGKRKNSNGDIVQIGADGVEVIVLRASNRASTVSSMAGAPPLPSVDEHGPPPTSSRKHSTSSCASGSSDASSTSSLFDSYSEGSSRSSFSSSKSSCDAKDRPERPHRHRSSKILSAMKAQHTAEKLEMSSMLEESKEAVDVLKKENGQLREECAELRALVLDIRRVIQGDTFVGLGLNATVPIPATGNDRRSSLLPPALIRSERSDSESSASSARSLDKQGDDSFGGGVGRQWFDDGSSDEEEDDDEIVRDLLAAFPPSPTKPVTVVASPPPSAPLPPTPNFGFRYSSKSTPASPALKKSTIPTFSRIPKMPKTPRATSSSKLVIGEPQGFRSI